MANPRAFISFDFDNNKSDRLLFVGQAKNSNTPFNIEDWSSKKELPQKEWEELINKKVNKCNMLIVLVGKKTYTATGVIKEINFAKENDVPIFGVYVDGANSKTSLPYGLQRNRTISWKWSTISNAIDQCMTEGKNK
ncbi:TIR domain-containing protein [uncultured Lacinutrix sp.]|uniref:TIR domain-containing protein n=1 Tax=uncultured Lacinutrix sp. TaxID=574032 RepID=UPI00261EB09D|nr:TIR domain-containing protein [uncultured Lacinutrix sp.]